MQREKEQIISKEDEMRSMKELYENNEDFKGYVDRCCAKNGFHKTATLEEVLSRAVTREVADMYRNYKNNSEKKTCSTFTPQGECL